MAAPLGRGLEHGRHGPDHVGRLAAQRFVVHQPRPSPQHGPPAAIHAVPVEAPRRQQPLADSHVLAPVHGPIEGAAVLRIVAVVVGDGGGGGGFLVAGASPQRSLEGGERRQAVVRVDGSPVLHEGPHLLGGPGVILAPAREEHLQVAPRGPPPPWLEGLPPVRFSRHRLQPPQPPLKVAVRGGEERMLVVIGGGGGGDFECRERWWWCRRCHCLAPFWRARAVSSPLLLPAATPRYYYQQRRRRRRNRRRS